MATDEAGVLVAGIHEAAKASFCARVHVAVAEKFDDRLDGVDQLAGR